MIWVTNKHADTLSFPQTDGSVKDVAPGETTSVLQDENASFVQGWSLAELIDVGKRKTDLAPDKPAAAPPA